MKAIAVVNGYKANCKMTRTCPDKKVVKELKTAVPIRYLPKRVTILIKPMYGNNFKEHNHKFNREHLCKLFID